MEQFCIGKLEGGPEEEVQHTAQPSDRVPKPPATTRKNQSQISTHGLITVAYVSVACVTVFGLGTVLNRLFGHDEYHLHLSGFWSGTVISGAAFSLIGIIIFFQLEKAMDVYPDFRSFPAHYLVTDKVAEVTKTKGILNPREYQTFPLVRKDKVSPNAINLTFGLPSPNSILGLPIGQHVAIRADVNGKRISRSYTPISNNSDRGQLRKSLLSEPSYAQANIVEGLAIKIYPDGQLTGGYLSNLKVGDLVQFRGPNGTMRYRKGKFNQLGMIAGGTGITPMYQLIRAICEDKTDTTKISLILGNSSEEDILLRTELENFQRQSPDKLKVWYMLNSPPKRWSYGQGFVTKEILEQRMPPVARDTQILVCGPPGLVKGCKQSLDTLGYEKPHAVSKATDQVFIF